MHQWVLIKIGILFSQVEIICDVSFHLTFKHLKFSSTTLNNIWSSSSPQNFIFQSLRLWTFAKTFHSNHYCQIFQELRPPQILHLNDLLVPFPEKKRTIFKSLFRTMLCFKVNVGNHCLLYVSRWNRSTFLLNL